MMKTSALAIGLLFATSALAQQPAQNGQPGQPMTTLSGSQQPQQTGSQPFSAQPQTQQPDKLQAVRQQIDQQVKQLEEQVKSLQAQLQADQQLLTRLQQVHQALQ